LIYDPIAIGFGFIANQNFQLLFLLTRLHYYADALVGIPTSFTSSGLFNFRCACPPYPPQAEQAGRTLVLTVLFSANDRSVIHDD